MLPLAVLVEIGVLESIGPVLAGRDVFPVDPITTSIIAETVCVEHASVPLATFGRFLLVVFV